MNHATDNRIAVGIDLGTTFSVIAHVGEDGQPRIIPNTDNQRTTPSVVYIEGDTAVVGHIAKEQTQVAAANTIQFVKLHIGRQFKRFNLGGQEWSPEEISGIILRKLIDDTHVAMPGREVTHAVITVPAFFTEQQRKSTEDAGRVASLQVLGVINEPTAAALAYGFDSLGIDKTVVVYDLGGGTFDVTVMRIAGHTITMLATDGDVQLGGKDWDERIIERLGDQFESRHGVDPREDPEALQHLYIQAEQAKLRLSKLPSTRIAVTYDGRVETVELSRDDFEMMTEDLLGQTETTLQLTLEEAGVSPREVDECLLVGGSTRMLAVRTMVQNMLGREPSLLLNPDECVAQGASIHAVMTQMRLADEGRDVPPIRVRNEHLDRFRQMEERLINPHTLGIVALGPEGKPVVAPIISRREFIPCRKLRVFRTSVVNQQQIRIVVMEGELPQPEACTELGTCVIRGLPGNLAQGTPIEVSFECSHDGTLNVTARLPTIQQTIESRIMRTVGLTDEAIADARDRLSLLRIS